MAAPARQDLTITRGDTEVVEVTITTDGTTPVDIAGRTYASQMRTSPDITAIAITGTCTITSAANGQMKVVFAAADTADLDPGYLYWDLQETNGSVVTTILSGTVTVLADVTR